MLHFLKSFLLIAITAVSALAANAKTAVSAPDFNYPKKVAIVADVDLKTALKSGDGQKAVDAIVRYSLAKSSISKDNLADVIGKIDSVVAIEKRPDHKALLLYFEATAFKSYMNTYGVPGRKNPVGTHPKDYTEWDNSQFNAKISELVDQSLSNSDALKKCPISNYTAIIVQDKDHLADYTPTLFEFLSCKAVDLTSNLAIEKKWIQEATTQAARIFASYSCPKASNESPAALYEKFKANAHSALFLRSKSSLYASYEENDEDDDDNDDDLPSNRTYYNTLQEYLNLHPGSIYANSVRNEMNALVAKMVSASYSQDLSSADSIVVDARYSNICKFTLSLYQVPKDLASQKNKWHFPLSSLKLIESRNVSLPEVAEPFDSTRTAKRAAVFAPQPYGEYIIVPSYTTAGSLKSTTSVNRNDFMRVHDIAIFLVNKTDAPHKVFAVNMSNGRPMKNVSMSSNKFATGKTDANGAFSIPSNVELAEIKATMGKDTYTPPITFYRGYLSSGDAASSQIFTDLALYRPGETVKFTSVSYYTDKSMRKVMDGKKIKFSLLDTNDQLVDTLCAVTDEFGRAGGQFTIPTGRLNGNFRITAESDAFSADGGKSIAVSEYKTPTFVVSLPNAKSGFTSGQDVTLQGKVETYSGLPVANTKVALSLIKTPWSWWRGGDGESATLHSDSVLTDAQGAFSITYPAALFKTGDKRTAQRRFSFDFSFYRYSVIALCTNSAGETQETRHTFTVGTHRGVAFVPGSDLEFLNDKPIKLPVAYRSNADTAALCTFTLSKDGKALVSGRFNSSEPVVDFTSMESGKYDLQIAVADDSTAEFDKASIVLVRSGDSRCPIDVPMWIPKSLRSINDKNMAHITIGTATPESHIYFVASNRSTIIKEGWLDYRPGMHQLSFKVPESGDERVYLQFFCFYGNKSHDLSFNMVSPVNSGSVKIVASSFRDKLISGSKEKWTFRITDKKQNPITAGAVALSMTDKAINDIASNDWSLSIGNYSTLPFSIRCFLPRYNASTQLSWTAKYLNARTFVTPELQTYGKSLFQRVMYLRGISKSSRMALEECVVTSTDEAAVATSPMAFASKKLGSANGAASAGKLRDMVLRSSAVKTALWCPALNTNPDGSVSIEFDTPDYATTWNVKALAFNKQLLSDVFKAEVITSKPLMVKPSLPRFVRQSDKSVLAATVQNATDSALTCDAVIEIFDPRTGKLLASRNFAANSISAKGTSALTIDYAVPDTAAFLGFRIKAANGNFSDGEQTMLPVLPAISPVIETKPFYIEPTQGESVITLPEFADGSRVTLEYCDNPVWYCIQALPTIFSDNSVTASALAHNLFAAAVAQGLAKSNPKIHEAVSYWKSAAGDSALTSMLNRNSDLKIGTLMASPWVREADRQSLRMSRLCELFDSAKMSSTVTLLISKLKDLQNSDGGWSWFRYPGCKSSLYTTNEVLQLLGEINRLGFMPANSDLASMIGKAVKYYDNEHAEILKERRKQHAKSPYSGFAPYVYTRTLLANVPQSADTQSLIGNALKVMTKEWRGLPVADKAYFAMALKRNGYASVAADIVQSIREFAITKPNTGMYWDNLQSGWRWFDKVAVTSTVLEAMSEVGSPSAELDQVRKWILLNKQTNDWGSSSLAANAVYALLTTGSQWLAENGTPAITLDYGQFEFDQMDKYLGYARKSIPAKSKGIIKISRNGANPAWGAVYAQFHAPMASVKAHSTADLSVVKEFLVYGADGSLSKATTLKVGDKVQVRTIIKNSKELDFVTLTDERAACFEPVDKTSGYKIADNNYYYLETKDSNSNIFFARLAKGTHIISYDVYVTAPGFYNAGIATAQCQYAPQVTAHSAGQAITVAEGK